MAGRVGMPVDGRRNRLPDQYRRHDLAVCLLLETKTLVHHTRARLPSASRASSAASPCSGGDEPEWRPGLNRPCSADRTSASQRGSAQLTSLCHRFHATAVAFVTASHRRRRRPLLSMCFWPLLPQWLRRKSNNRRFFGQRGKRASGCGNSSSKGCPGEEALGNIVGDAKNLCDVAIVRI